MARNTVSYQPDNCLKKGYVGLWGELFRELYANRWLTAQLLKRDLVALYKQSMLGFLWLLINPLISVATFVILSKSDVFSIGKIPVPYGIYAVLGMSIWQLFAVGIVASAGALVNAGSMISKINFSRKSLVIASMGHCLLSSAIQTLLVLVLFLVYGVTPSAYILLIPFMAIPMVMLTLGLGFLVALLNAVIRDVASVIPVLVNFLLLLTPVLYAKKGGILGAMTECNPLYYLVTVPRDIVLTGHSSQMNGYLLAAGLSLAVLAACLVIFHLTESRIAERI